MLRGGSAFCVNHPTLRFAAESFGEFFWTIGENVPEPGFAPSTTFQQRFRRFEIAPFELQAVGFLGSEHTFFPRFERQTRATSVMAAFDAEVVYALRKIQDVVALEAQVVEGVLPLAPGIEVADFSFVPSFADLDVPRAHARALKTRAQDDSVLIVAFGFVGDNRAAPIQLCNRAP